MSLPVLIVLKLIHPKASDSISERENSELVAVKVEVGDGNGEVGE